MKSIVGEFALDYVQSKSFYVALGDYDMFVLFRSGTVKWWCNGSLHNEHGPAVSSPNTGDEYWHHGVFFSHDRNPES